MQKKEDEEEEETTLQLPNHPKSVHAQIESGYRHKQHKKGITPLVLHQKRAPSLA